MRIVFFIALLCAAAWGEWDRFRGPNGSGISDATDVPAEFGPQKNLIRTVRGEGYQFCLDDWNRAAGSLAAAQIHAPS